MQNKTGIHTQTGWSLLELMVVLCLISIMGTFSLSALLQFQQARYLNEVSAELLAFLNHAQQEAYWLNQNMRVEVKQGTGATWWVQIQRDIQENGLVGEGHRFMSQGDAVSWVEDSPAHTLRFYGRRGGANAGHIRLKNGAGEVKVILSAKGRLRRCSEGGQVAGIGAC